MEKLRFAICGMGNRGTRYMEEINDFPDIAEITAISDIRPERLLAAKKKIAIPENHFFNSAEAMIEAPGLADVMIISTQDAQHRVHAIAAMENGYDLILEKPVANNLEDCLLIRDTAERLKRRVLVCHVLRYTPFYRTIKNMIDEGRIGKVESINAVEGVGYYHYAHSYVRGNWHKKSNSSPMILAKCCHDLDLILWLSRKNCIKITSFGSLDYFKRENAPEGSAERCFDCKVENCPFNAPKFYYSRIPKWPSNLLHPEPTVENITAVLKTTDYGKCVFRMDNDVVDHQVVNMLLAGGATAGLQMTGFTRTIDRSIRVMGTEGEIWGNFSEKLIHSERFGEKEEIIDVTEMGKTFRGHGGGDAGLIRDAIRYFRNEDLDRTSITEIGSSIESHILAFKAEESRLLGGQVIDLLTK